ncbi:unnamed protein product [Rotaria socialis]|uniref:Uncharacterized protein n=1 Tax=Rotaria socialis TaxID=392032 RepID=A0A821TQM5_9BILA|nr:unnamed protein product [Rotaria socialis]
MATCTVKFLSDHIVAHMNEFDCIIDSGSPFSSGLFITVMGIPIITLNSIQEDKRIFFDIGATLSYLSQDLRIGTSTGDMNHFDPTLGSFTANVYKIDVALSRTVETLTFGSLPYSMRMPLWLNG